MDRTVGSFSLHEFKSLNAIATHLSFRGAAASLQMPPSSLSHMVASVERRLGIRLFQRNTRSVSLTCAGEAFLARMLPALRDMEGAIEGVNDFRDKPSGQIRLNTSEYAAESILPIVIEFTRAFPEVMVDVVTEGRLIDIVAEGFDAGFRLAEAVPQDMIALSLDLDEAFIIVAAPSYLDRRGRPGTPTELLAHDCIRSRLPSGAMMRWEIQKGGEETWVDVTGQLILGTADLALRAAVAGAGIAYVSARNSEPHLASGDLVHLLNEWTPPFSGFCLYYPRMRLPSAALRAFIDHFRTHCLTARNLQDAYISAEPRKA